MKRFKLFPSLVYVVDCHELIDDVKKACEEIDWADDSRVNPDGSNISSIKYALQLGNHSHLIEKFEKKLNDTIKELNYDNWMEFADDTSLIVNATPLGMVPNTDASPIQDHEIDHLTGKVCYDIVYNPRETKFLKQAKQADGIPVGGLDMLIYQGAKSFELWTGKHFPLGLVNMKLDEVFPH